MTRPTRALLVDDDPRYRLLVHHVLDRSGIATLEAQPGDDVLDLARRERPDVILLDWRMPGVNGLQLCRRLRTHPETKGIPVLMVTGLSGHKEREDALEAGAAALVTKGSAVELASIVRETVATG